MTPSHLGGPAMKAHGGSNVNMARFSRMVLNHAPIGSYRQRFFPGEPVNCNSCGRLQTRAHVLLECDCYRRRWRHNSIEELLRKLDPFAKVNTFIEENQSAFSFEDAPVEPVME